MSLKVLGVKRLGQCLALLSLIGLSACLSEQQRSINPVLVNDFNKPHQQYGSQIVSSYSNSYALLIGQSSYIHWDSLRSVPAELDKVEKVLKNQGFVVEKELNLNARQLRDRFEKFVNNYGLDANHRLLFYFGGHGHTRQYLGKDKGYIVPIDAPNPLNDEKAFIQKAISMDQIYAWAKRLEVNHALFVFDSCFSGTILKVRSNNDVPPYIKESAAEPVRQFITAGKANESVPENSVFTPMFVDALRLKKGDWNQDGYVTGFEICLHLKNEVPKYYSQHPQCGTIKDYELSNGDFVFKVGGGSSQIDSPSAVPASQPDRDRDGVADEQDNCPSNTTDELTKGVFVDGPNKGCPLDTDQDRVADYRDGCPYNQPAEMVHGVNSTGCPMDSDQDGVADYQDRCRRNRAEQLKKGIDQQGCPLDRDHDRVADYQDECLGSQPGVEVDQLGCQVLNTPTRPTTNNIATMRSGTVFKDRLKSDGYGPEMVWIPAGQFRMGDIQGGGDDDEQPVHSVSVNQLAMGQHELTVGEFRQFVNATGYRTDAEKEGNCFSWANGFKSVTGANWRNPGISQTDKHPVVCVSWNDANAYMEWLSQQTGHQYRLPTEAQWEYAARAGTTTKYWWGNDIGSNKANCNNNYCGDRFQYTAPVGSFAKNPFGLYDTVGNVWEWTCSEYKDKYNGQEQQCVDSAGLFVVRSGSWDGNTGRARSADRSWREPAGRLDTYGVRPARIR